MNFEGLKINALAQGDEELKKLTAEQQKRKKEHGDNRVFLQTGHHDDTDSSISSSDEEDLNGHIQAGQEAEKEEEQEKTGRFHSLQHPRTSVLKWAGRET